LIEIFFCYFRFKNLGNAPNLRASKKEIKSENNVQLTSRNGLEDQKIRDFLKNSQEESF